MSPSMPKPPVKVEGLKFIPGNLLVRINMFSEYTSHGPFLSNLTCFEYPLLGIEITSTYNNVFMQR